MVKWRKKGVFWNKYVAWVLNKSSGSAQAQDSQPKASILKTFGIQSEWHSLHKLALLSSWKINFA